MSYSFLGERVHAQLLSRRRRHPAGQTKQSPVAAKFGSLLVADGDRTTAFPAAGVAVVEEAAAV
jgi:hypothetical protein